MAAPRPKGRDFGAALAGLVLGSSVIFLIVLIIVWLTNSKFEGHEAEKAAPSSPPAGAAVAAPATTANPAVKH